MKYTRIMTYEKQHDEKGTEKFTGCEHYYFGEMPEALARFLREYPEHAGLIIKCQSVDDEDPKWKEMFRIARNCGCVHFF